MRKSNLDQQISSFSVGAGLGAMSAFLGWIIFQLKMMMINPAADYWATVLERAQSDPLLTTMFGLCCVGVLVGVVMMLRAIVGEAKQKTVEIDQSPK